MIDTALLVWEGSPDSKIEERLRDPDVRVDARTGEVKCITGGIRNLHVRAYPERTLIRGSLPVACYGSNFRLLNPTGTRELLTEIGEILRAPLGDAYVYQLDFGLNLPLPIPISEVLSRLGPIPRHQKHTYDGARTGVTYRAGKRRAISLYNKAVEVVAKGKPVPEEYRGQNMLRAEIQLKNKVADQIGERVYGRTLWEPRFHERLVERWAAEMERLSFLYPVSTKMETNWKSYRDSRAAIGIKALGGVEAELARMEEASVAGSFDGCEHNFSRMKGQLLKLVAAQRPDVPTGAEEAFREAVEKAAKEYRVMLN